MLLHLYLALLVSPLLPEVKSIIPLQAINTAALLLIAFIFGVNNAGVVIGPMLSSGFRYRRGMLITIIGFASGLLLEGYKMDYTIVAESTGMLDMGDIARGITLIITLSALLLSSSIGMPISMVNTLFAGYIGTVMSINPLYYEQISRQALITVMLWILLPLIAFLSSIVTHRVTLYAVRLLGLISISRFYYIALQLALFYAAYTIGSNNLGLLYSIGYESNGNGNDNGNGIMLMPLMLSAFALGIINGQRVSRFIGEGMVGLTPARILSSIVTSSIILWIATQMHAPSSFLHLLICSLLGVGITTKPSVYNRRRIMLLLVSWVFITLTSFIAGFALNSIIRQSLINN